MWLSKTVWLYYLTSFTSLQFVASPFLNCKDLSAGCINTFIHVCCDLFSYMICVCFNSAIQIEWLYDIVFESCGDATVFEELCVYDVWREEDYEIDLVCVSLKVFGELPTLSIGLTDQRVTEILQILVSIPLPEGYSDEDVNEFAKSVSVLCCLFVNFSDNIGIFEYWNRLFYSRQIGLAVCEHLHAH